MSKKNIIILIHYLLLFISIIWLTIITITPVENHYIIKGQVNTEIKRHQLTYKDNESKNITFYSFGYKWKDDKGTHTTCINNTMQDLDKRYVIKRGKSESMYIKILLDKRQVVKYNYFYCSCWSILILMYSVIVLIIFNLYPIFIFSIKIKCKNCKLQKECLVYKRL